MFHSSVSESVSPLVVKKPSTSKTKDISSPLVPKPVVAIPVSQVQGASKVTLAQKISMKAAVNQ